jgi:tRNA pseudouridine(55) synthase
MLELYKRRGETPLEAIERLREESPELAGETLSYAGRLDPMAEGILPVLVGEDENRRRAEFLGKRKQYVAHFLLGFETDTGDVLGLVTRRDVRAVDDADIERAVRELGGITQQTYPWYSSKTVDGVPLFEHARAGNFLIERPVREVHVDVVSGADVSCESDEGIIADIIRDISLVRGDFRQDKIRASWEGVPLGKTVQLVSCVLEVSSGTYIRALTETLAQKLGVPVVLYRLVRTRVF